MSDWVVGSLADASKSFEVGKKGDCPYELLSDYYNFKLPRCISKPDKTSFKSINQETYDNLPDSFLKFFLLLVDRGYRWGMDLYLKSDIHLIYQFHLILFHILTKNLF
jgi:hypothetical protein